MDGLKLNAFGGSLAAKIFVEKMQRLSVEGNLRNFSLPVLARSFTGKQLGYDGTIDGSIKAHGDLESEGHDWLQGPSATWPSFRAVAACR